MAKYYDRCWNPIMGCEGNFKGCNHCFAKELLFKRNSNCDFKKVQLNRNQYLKVFEKKSQLIAVCTQSDLFQDKVSDKIIDGVLRKCNNAKQNNYLFLTKYADRMKSYFDNQNCLINLNNNHINQFSFDNMIMGVTVCSNEDLHRIDKLKSIHYFKHKFISFEPILERIELTEDDLNGIDWIIIGAETGNNAVYCDIQWMIDIVHIAEKINIPIFVNSIHLNNGKITSEFDEFPQELCKNNIPFKI